MHHAVIVVIAVFGSSDNAVVVKVDVEAKEFKIRVSDVLAPAAVIIALGVVGAHRAADSYRAFLRLFGLLRHSKGF